MVETALAFCPGHISGYFKRIEGSDPASTGSVGAGVVIDEGVTAAVSPAPATGIRVIRRSAAVVEETAGSPPIEYALRKLGVSASVRTECRLPIGAGFGLSAAALLATLTAANHLFSLGLSAREVAAAAHEAEVLHRTGLGDVAACQGGGIVCRTGPGVDAPILRLQSDAGLYAVTLAPLPTASVLSSGAAMARIASAFPDACPRNLAEFCLLSREFAERSGLIAPSVRKVLESCDTAGVPASMTMLGNGVFCCSEAGVEVLAGYGTVYPLSVARQGVRLLEAKD
jgi:pantoate kinase